MMMMRTKNERRDHDRIYVANTTQTIIFGAEQSVQNTNQHEACRRDIGKKSGLVFLVVFRTKKDGLIILLP